MKYSTSAKKKTASKSDQELKVSFREKMRKFNLRQVSCPEVKRLRKSKGLKLVVKHGKHLYIDEKPGKVGKNVLGDCHLCPDCRRMYALPDDMGGCSKVLTRDSCLEDFPFIRTGIETFNHMDRHGNHEGLFIVASCDNFEPEPEKEPIPLKEVERRRRAIAQFVVPDLPSSASLADLEDYVKRFGISL